MPEQKNLNGKSHQSTADRKAAVRSVPPHPAKYADVVLAEIASLLAAESDGQRLKVLDPFAGVGRIHELDHDTVGVEIEKEWAAAHRATLVGDATSLPFLDQSFDAIVTSPCYGNRMADHHEARGASRRHTYRHALGRPLSPNSAGALQWGEQYRQFHRLAWQEAYRTLRPRGLCVVVVSDISDPSKGSPSSSGIARLGSSGIPSRAIHTGRHPASEARCERQGTRRLRGDLGGPAMTYRVVPVHIRGRSDYEKLTPTQQEARHPAFEAVGVMRNEGLSLRARRSGRYDTGHGSPLRRRGIGERRAQVRARGQT